MKKTCIDCHKTLPTSSQYLPVIRCRNCYYINRYTDFKAHPNSLKALKPKSREWLQKHKIHLNHPHSELSKKLMSKQRKGKALGENNARWNNGQSINKKTGYRSILVKTGEPHRMEHRHVMEQVVGRELSTQEVVHHLDHDRLNNDVSNLILMDRSEHGSLHRKGII